MKLAVGLCYSVLLANNSVVTFKFIGQNAQGTILAEVPPNSGQHQDLYQILRGGYLAYWEVKCP